MNNAKCEAAINDIVKYYEVNESDKTRMHTNEIYSLSYLIDEMDAYMKVNSMHELTISELKHVIAKVIFALNENRKKVSDKPIANKVE